MNKILRFSLMTSVLLGVIVVYDGCYIIEEGKQAVLTQFGAPVGKPDIEAGLYFKIPFIQIANIFEKKILIWDGEPNQIPTNDKTYVFLDATARWRISDPLKFMQAVRTESRAQSMLNDIINGTIRDMVNKNDLIEIIRSSDWSEETMSPTTESLGTKPKQGRDKIAITVLNQAAKMTPQYGITLIDVMIKRVNYIDSVQQTVFNRMISERKRIAAEKRSTGEGKKAEILGQVERELKQILSAANMEALGIRGKADAEATKIYGKAYSQDPNFYAFLNTLESYPSVVGGNTSFLLSLESELYQYLNSASGNKPATKTTK